jgi:MinD-like ATPase involved in chromosome partitioning or flagellar assembly
MKILSICSGKGGVGKTSIAVNLGAALHSLNRRVVIVDCNMTTSHIGLMYGFYAGKNFNNFLRNEAKIEETIHMHPSGLAFIPAALELNELANMETHNLKESLRSALPNYDFVLLDSAPGIGREALIALRACDEVLFVANPYIPSVVDVLKTKNLSSRMGFYNLGLVLNKVEGKKHELTKHEVFHFTELPVIASIPMDEAILKSVNSRKIPFYHYPNSSSSRAFMELAYKIAGLPYRRGL